MRHDRNCEEVKRRGRSQTPDYGYGDYDYATFNWKAVAEGITKGCSVFVRKVAPLGDPVEVTVRGYELSLRKQDAELIVVE